ncbi:DUF5343 domain-containing protein [Thauera sp. SDU_THAU2]|uniref:DUF5343 domain-containing protein n=1 Tax=Thauera sp. SDU_THAU2 TaxID=3136633 RepID=UPI004054AD66
MTWLSDGVRLADRCVVSKSAGQRGSDLASEQEASAAPANPEKTARRKIPGGLPYTSSPGSCGVSSRRYQLRRSRAPSPMTFSARSWNARGGAARPIIPILKATGFLNQTGAPTELYAQFQTDAGRPAAALQCPAKWLRRDISDAISTRIRPRKLRLSTLSWRSPASRRKKGLSVTSSPPSKRFKSMQKAGA